MSGVVPATKCTLLWPTSKAALWQIGTTGSICNSATAGLRAGRAIGAKTGLDTTEYPPMSTKILAAIATVLGALALFAQDSTFAQDAGPYEPPGHRPFLRRDLSYHAWYYDGRDDDRDFPTNGFFPGDFAADPAHAAIGAAGLFGFTPDYRGYYQAGCTRQQRSHDAATGYFVGYYGARHRCR